MSKEIIKSVEDSIEPEIVKETIKSSSEREIELVFVSDGVYKYVYSDTKEDVK